MSEELEQQPVDLTAQRHAQIDALELAMLNSDPAAFVDFPLVHRFTPGIYIREIFNPAGSLITTKVHRFEHPFVVLKGRISTFVPEDGGHVEHLSAPYIGITKAGTRRVIYAHEDTVFVTFHANPDDGQDVDAIEERIIERRELLDGHSTFEFYREILRLREEDAKQLGAGGASS